MSLPADLRAACSQVAARAIHVRIDQSAIPEYAERLAREETLTTDQPKLKKPADREDAAARVLILDAINFGSGWFPTLNKRPGLSGYRTIAKGLDERFDQCGPWTASELAAVNAEELAITLQQPADHPLVALFVASLRDLGAHVGEAGFAHAVDHTGAKASELVEALAAWDCFQDESTYDELTLPFLKRAQIAAADLHRAGVADYSADLHELTIFADNLVPHVLTLDGILTLRDPLAATITREEVIEHGSKPEVELRACAVHAVELLKRHLGVTAAQLDTVLWERGGRPFYKASPRPRSRTTAY